MLKIENMPCLVIGGGTVAERKVQTLLEFGAYVKVISPEITKNLQSLYSNSKIEWSNKEFEKGDTFDFRLVFNTAPAIAESVKKDCMESGAILNSADKPEISDFIVPSSINKKNFSVSVSTHGNAPFITKHTKKQLDDFLPKNIENIVLLANELRSIIIGNKSYSKDEKHVLYDKFIHIDWEKIIDEKGIDNARKLMLEILDKE